jgi:hypothetical protein
VTVQQRADDSAVQDPVERLVMRLRAPLRDDLVPLDAALDPQPFLVGRPAPEAAVVRRVGVLKAWHLRAID